jgi:plastocyanin
MRAAFLFSCALALAIVWAAMSPVGSDDRDEIFEIPKGTYARRMAGDKVDILPSQVRLTLGVKDVLVLRNHDDVPQVFGPVLMMPGQSFRLPFEVASSYQFACTAHASGQMTVVVAPGPDSAWERLAWRTRALMASL